MFACLHLLLGRSCRARQQKVKTPQIRTKPAIISTAVIVLATAEDPVAQLGSVVASTGLEVCCRRVPDCGILTYCCRPRQIRPSSRYKHANTPHTSSMMSSTLENVYLVDALNANFTKS